MVTVNHTRVCVCACMCRRTCACVRACSCVCTCVYVHVFVCACVLPSFQVSVRPRSSARTARPPSGVQQTNCVALQLCGLSIHNCKVRNLRYRCAGQRTARMSLDLTFDLLEIVCFTTDVTLNNIVTSEAFLCEPSN